MLFLFGCETELQILWYLKAKFERFSYFSVKTYFVTPNQNCLWETVLSSGDSSNKGLRNKLLIRNVDIYP